MTDIEILRAAEAIIRRATPTTEHERDVFRDTLTGLVWARVDLVIAEHGAWSHSHGEEIHAGRLAGCTL